MNSLTRSLRASRRALFAGLALLPLLATGYWSQNGSQIYAPFGLSIGGASSNSVSFGDIAIGYNSSIGVGDYLNSIDGKLVVGHGGRSTPDPNNAHLTVKGASNFSAFVVYGDRAVVPGASRMIIQSPAGDIPSYSGQ